MTGVIGEIGKWWGSLAPWARLTISSFVVLAMWLALFSSYLENAPLHGYVRGGSADWLVTTEAVHGTDAYRPEADLAFEYFGWQDVLPDDPHPRPPSAILVLTPLSLVPGSLSLFALAIVSAPSLAWFVRAIVVWLGLSPSYEMLVLPVALSLPIAQGVVWGTHIPIVAALIGGSLLYRGRKNTTSGAMIGLAASLKVFPIALAFGDRRGRFRVLSTAAVVMLVLTGLGLLLPGVHPSGAISAVLDARGNFGGSPTDFSFNRFFAGQPVATVMIFGVGLALIAYIGQRMHPIIASSSALILMLLFSPFAWPEYLLLVLPALFVLLRSGKAARWIAIIGWVGLSLTNEGPALSAISTAILIAVLVLPSLESARSLPPVHMEAR